MILKDCIVNYAGICLPRESKFLYTNYVDMQDSLVMIQYRYVSIHNYFVDMI